MVLDWDLQEELITEIDQIRSADRVKLSTNSVTSEIVDNLHGRGEARDFSFEYDEPESVAGGENRGPRPLEYFLAGWAFCQQVQYSRNALLTGIEFENLEMEMAGDINPRSSLDETEGGVPVGFVDDELRMTTQIESDAHPDEVRELVERARKDCHAHASLQRKMTIESDVFLNGDLLDV